MSRGRGVPRDVFGEVRDVNGRPPAVHDVDEHQRVVIWEMDIAVVRRVIGAVPGELDALTGDAQGTTIRKRLFRRRPGRVVVAQEEPPRLLVPDANDILPEEGGRTGVVGVVV